MTNNQNYQPVYIMPEGSQRTSGKSAQRLNITAAKLVAETVRTTLGPKGMDKMLVDSANEITVTNDGATILDEMSIEHPTAKMIVEIARTQEDEVGDGTTTAVILAGEFLKQAEELLDQNIHPTNIIKGYRLAAEKSQVILNNMAVKLKEDDEKTLRKIAMTAMTGKGAEAAKEHLANLAVKAVRAVTEKKDDETYIDEDSIKINKKIGGKIEESELVEGIIIDKERVANSMPRKVEGANIALIDTPLEIKETSVDAKISITDPNQMQSFLDMEEQMLNKMVQQVVDSGANIIFCQKGIDDMAQHFLSEQGIMAIRRVKKSDLEAISKATGGRIVTNLSELKKEHLGYAGVVEEKKVADERMVYVTNCKNPKAITIMVRSSTDHVADEIQRAMDDAIGNIKATLKYTMLVGGAGSPEVEVSRNLRKYAESLSGREQLAVLAFANAVEVVPKTLAENAGIDPIDIMTELKSAHNKGTLWSGINVFTGKVMDSWKEGVIEPLKIKTQAISSASEVAIMILRIDDMILAGTGHQQQPQQQMPQGYPDMM